MSLRGVLFGNVYNVVWIIKDNVKYQYFSAMLAVVLFIGMGILCGTFY